MKGRPDCTSSNVMVQERKRLAITRRHRTTRSGGGGQPRAVIVIVSGTHARRAEEVAECQCCQCAAAADKRPRVCEGCLEGGAGGVVSRPAVVADAVAVPEQDVTKRQ